MYLIDEVLANYATEGASLYDTLFLQPVVINNRNEAEKYLSNYARYTFINDMFQAMQLYNWRKGLLDKLEITYNPA